jgi:hypothetical protein
MWFYFLIDNRYSRKRGKILYCKGGGAQDKSSKCLQAHKQFAEIVVDINPKNSIFTNMRGGRISC